MWALSSGLVWPDLVVPGHWQRRGAVSQHCQETWRWREDPSRDMPKRPWVSRTALSRVSSTRPTLLQ